MSPTMTEGGIAEWKKQVGDSFTAGDVVFEIVRCAFLSFSSCYSFSSAPFTPGPPPRRPLPFQPSRADQLTASPLLLAALNRRPTRPPWTSSRKSSLFSMEPVGDVWDRDEMILLGRVERPSTFPLAEPLRPFSPSHLDGTPSGKADMTGCSLSLGVLTVKRTESSARSSCVLCTFDSKDHASFLH